MSDLRDRIDKLVSRGWTEEAAMNYIDNVADSDQDDDDWFMVYDRKTGRWIDLRLEE